MLAALQPHDDDAAEGTNPVTDATEIGQDDETNIVFRLPGDARQVSSMCHWSKPRKRFAVAVMIWVFGAKLAVEGKRADVLLSKKLSS